MTISSPLLPYVVRRLEEGGGANSFPLLLDTGPDTDSNSVTGSVAVLVGGGGGGGERSGEW